MSDHDNIRSRCSKCREFADEGQPHTCADGTTRTHENPNAKSAESRIPKGA